MRVARLVGLSPDGRFVIVATERGEELAIAADDRLRAALRGDRPRLGQLEIDMESALSPREIQTRIRSGESVEDVARVAGIERERVERFAAPVIAEREHVAGLAMTSSARRRGETSSHRTLRGVLNERLLNRGVDIDTVRWDSYRVEDGRWAVTADYLSGETPRHAMFFFDVSGRYSVAGNDEGRWVLGDASPSRGPQPGRLPPTAAEQDDDSEPTLDLSDELALVRAIQDIPIAPRTEPEPVVAVEAIEVETTIAEVVQLNRVPDATSPADELDGHPPGEAEVDRLEADEDRDEEEPDSAEADDGASDPDEAAVVAAEHDAAEIGERAVEDTWPNDASAVPELSPSLQQDAWEPAIVVDYPVEPSDDEGYTDGFEVPEGSDDPGRPEPPVAGDDRRDEAATLTAVSPAELLEDSAEPAGVVEPAAPEQPEEQVLPLEVPEQAAQPLPGKPARRKRASVPSWDEIVFGGPKEQ
jgi:hypothetical protein